jgi:hypothetical protein
LRKPRFGICSFMFWLSQIFENVNIADAVEESTILKAHFHCRYMTILQILRGGLQKLIRSEFHIDVYFYLCNYFR